MIESSHASLSMYYLITGGCGFLGTSLISHLLKENPGFKIRVLDNLSIGSKDDLAEVCAFQEVDILHLTSHTSPLSVELVVGDIKDPGTCEMCCAGIDVVIHLAANTGVGPSVENPRADMEANVIGLFNMLEASRKSGVQKFVFSSSGAPIGEVEPPIHEEKAPKPVSPYGASKLAGEGYCSAYYRTFGLQTISLRFGNVYGPRSKHKSSIVAKFFKQALSCETLEIYGDGNQTRDFIYIDDLIRAICLAVNPEPRQERLKTQHSTYIESPYGEIFQIATHKETTVNEIATMIKEIITKETGLEVKVVHGKSRVGDVRRNFSEISKAERMLGWKPQFELDKGLRATYDYFRGDNL